MAARDALACVAADGDITAGGTERESAAAGVAGGLVESGALPEKTRQVFSTGVAVQMA